MTSGQSQSLRRIDRDRRAMHAVASRRLQSARRSGDFAGSVRRVAMLARLQGMRRAVLDASRALQKDVRVAHHELSAADDRKKDDRELLWLLAFLGLPTLIVSTIRDESYALADRVGAELRRIGEATAAKTVTVTDLKPTPEPIRTPFDGLPRTATDSLTIYRPGPDLKPVTRAGFEPRTTGPAIRTTGGNVGTLLRETTTIYGRANVSDAILDTWAETVAYSQYERGRFDAITIYPAISEALWGYRWSSILDNRTTVGCRLLDGWVAPLEDTWMKALSPPRHFNCRAALVPVWQSSELRPPIPQNRPTDATLQRYLAQKEAFIRRIA